MMRKINMLRGVFCHTNDTDECELFPIQIKELMDILLKKREIRFQLLTRGIIKEIVY